MGNVYHLSSPKGVSQKVLGITLGIFLQKYVGTIPIDPLCSAGPGLAICSRSEQRKLEIDTKSCFNFASSIILLYKQQSRTHCDFSKL